ncbi:hypothetical protein [Cesiribacter andamanensis]|uniref:Uncharacterized protein n=1 Tax=Cesiribacter andamanensis AMV16 TaxID=1279009 RepID=M7N177_9BACT|nr:hypothetical protein [Cesiribacter andamanensis]EMR01052.1 hypothetical protein ADICEAN_03823 [Cesiribacter andamanensis AMV16]
MNNDKNKPNERSWNDRNQHQNQPQNTDRSQEQNRSQQTRSDRSREGQDNELGARTEQLSPMGGGQHTNPQGRVQDQQNEEVSRRSPQNRQSHDLKDKNNS